MSSGTIFASTVSLAHAANGESVPESIDSAAGAASALASARSTDAAASRSLEKVACSPPQAEKTDARQEKPIADVAHVEKRTSIFLLPGKVRSESARVSTTRRKIVDPLLGSNDCLIAPIAPRIS